MSNHFSKERGQSPLSFEWSLAYLSPSKKLNNATLDRISKIHNRSYVESRLQTQADMRSYPIDNLTHATVDVSDYGAGLYYVRISTGSDIVYMEKFLVN